MPRPPQHLLSAICYLLCSSALPAPAAATADAVRAGARFLVGHQNADGSWGSARNTKGSNIYAPVPGSHHAFRAACTALCLEALTRTTGAPPEATNACDRAEAWLLAELPRVRRATPDVLYNVWAHAYAVQALAARLPQTADPDRRERLRAALAAQATMLARYASIDGGWSYYDFRAQTQVPSGQSLSFVDAAVLVALHAGREAGADVPVPQVRAALAALRRMRNPDDSFLYGEHHFWRPVLPANRPAGSLGRTQACLLALRLWDPPSAPDAAVRAGLERFVKREGWLDIGRKRPIPHEAWFSVAGYYFYFGHYYAARLAQCLPPEERAPVHRAIAETVAARQETDGSWWDFPFYDYHPYYGTAFALLTLAESGECVASVTRAGRSS